MLFRIVVFLMAGLISTGPLWAREWVENLEIASVFEKNGVTGTFVLYDVEADQLIGYNQARAETRYLPASTFKIPNSLIGLDIGAVKDVDEIIPYGGGSHFIKDWEMDMGLREAIKISNVPIYQELARRIGMNQMKTKLTRLDYGNNLIGDKVDDFWLEGPLKISAVEQTIFLARLAKEELPLARLAQKAVKGICLNESGDGWKLYAKTGAAMRVKPGTGWWVGWVDGDSRIYAFAINIDMNDLSKSSKRQELGRAALKILGVL